MEMEYRYLRNGVKFEPNFTKKYFVVRFPRLFDFQVHFLFQDFCRSLSNQRDDAEARFPGQSWEQKCNEINETMQAVP
jgi:hypothetical protein